MTSTAMKICRIDRICETSKRSVRIDERILKTFVGKTDGFFLVTSFVVLSTLETTFDSRTIEGRSAICLISDENSSRRL